MSRARGWLAVLLVAACAAPPPLRLLGAGQRVVVFDGGQVLAEYRGDAPRGPAVWPWLAPHGEPVTRAFPFFAVAGEPDDHPEHTSLWFAPGDLQGVTVWAGAGRATVDGAPRHDRARAAVAQELHWHGDDGALLARERRQWRFGVAAAERTLDLEVTLWRDAGELRLGAGAFGGFGLRLQPEWLPRGRWLGGAPAAAGPGDAAAEPADGARCRWVARQGWLGGAPVTLAVFDHPDNPGHPAQLRREPSGLLALGPALAAPVVAPAGAEVRLRYRAVVFAGHGDAAALDAAWRRFAAGG